MECRHIILRRLLRRDICGGKHLPEVLVLSWIKHLNRNDHARAMEDFECAVKQGVIVRFRHTGESHISIAAHMQAEIQELLDEP